MLGTYAAILPSVVRAFDKKSTITIHPVPSDQIRSRIARQGTPGTLRRLGNYEVTAVRLDVAHCLSPSLKPASIAYLPCNTAQRKWGILLNRDGHATLLFANQQSGEHSLGCRGKDGVEMFSVLC